MSGMHAQLKHADGTIADARHLKPVNLCADPGRLSLSTSNAPTNHASSQLSPEILGFTESRVPQQSGRLATDRNSRAAAPDAAPEACTPALLTKPAVEAQLSSLTAPDSQQGAQKPLLQAEPAEEGLGDLPAAEGRGRQGLIQAWRSPAAETPDSSAPLLAQVRRNTQLLIAYRLPCSAASLLHNMC